MNTVYLQQADLSLKSWCFHAIQQSYENTYLNIPCMRGKVQPANEEDVHAAIIKRKAFIIFLGSSRAGVIIYEPGYRAFISGCWITEEVILPEFRGKHLACAAQHALYLHLTKINSPTALWGTIVSDNKPSIRTAELAGRKRVMEYVFLREGDMHA